MARAVAVIQPCVPQRPPRERVELRARGAFGKTRQRELDVPLEHAREAVAHLGRGLAHRHRARHIGRAVHELRAGIDQEQLSRLDAAVGLARHAVMHDGAVRPRARDGIEADILQRAGGGAERFQFLHRVDLGQRALRRFAREPGEKPRQRLAVADMGAARAGQLRLVLARFGQLAGIGGADDFRAGLLQPLEDRGRRPGRDRQQRSCPSARPAPVRNRRARAHALRCRDAPAIRASSSSHP